MTDTNRYLGSAPMVVRFQCPICRKKRTAELQEDHYDQPDERIHYCGSCETCGIDICVDLREG